MCARMLRAQVCVQACKHTHNTHPQLYDQVLDGLVVASVPDEAVDGLREGALWDGASPVQERHLC